MGLEEAARCSFNPFDVTKVWPHSDYPLRCVRMPRLALIPGIMCMLFDLVVLLVELLSRNRSQTAVIAFYRVSIFLPPSPSVLVSVQNEGRQIRCCVASAPISQTLCFPFFEQQGKSFEAGVHMPIPPKARATFVQLSIGRSTIATGVRYIGPCALAVFPSFTLFSKGPSLCPTTPPHPPTTFFFCRHLRATHAPFVLAVR